MAGQQGPKLVWVWGNFTIISHLFEWEMCRVFCTFREKTSANRYDSARFDLCFSVRGWYGSIYNNMYDE